MPEATSTALMQLLCKSIWLIAVLPRGFDRPTTLIPVMAVGVLVDVVVMPWSYVVSAYVKSAGDRWK